MSAREAGDPFPRARGVPDGSVLGIVAPAGPFDREAFEAGVAWLRERFEVRFDESIFERDGYLAGSDERRLVELRRAIADPEIDAILCARGGYGATRLLPGIDGRAVAAAAKLLVGFSDVTALHAIWARAGVRSIHAPMVANLGASPGDLRERWLAALRQEAPAEPVRGIALAPGRAEGRLFGGNLALLTALLGTPFAPPVDGCLLFLEDVGERPYRVDRMLTQLDQAGWFGRVSGVVLGAFTEGEPGPDGVAIDTVLRRQFEGAAFPVLSGFPAGHVRDNTPLLFGAAARIDGDQFSLVPDSASAEPPA